MSPPVSDRVPPLAPARGSRSGLLLLLLLGAAAILWFGWFGRPELVFTNRLAAPVRLTLDDRTSLLAPGETRRVRVARGRALVAEWALERPVSPDSRPLGEEVRGSIVVRGPRGTIRRSAASRGLDADYFAPLVTNATHGPLRIVVNAGLAGARDCGCAVRPGARRAFIGYYRLFRNSTVEARALDGRRATFRDLGPEVRAENGTLGLRFEERDLRAR